MDKKYTRFRCLLLLLGLLAGWLSGNNAQAQTVGNEWIVPGQQYYKFKVVRDGLYRINAQYLSQAGITSVVPNELQIWRRGQQLATYVGGNRNTLDATTFLEFYAVHNDGKLDAELYKNPVDQPHPYYSFYTDTASYFITWTPGTAGRHMLEPVVAGGTTQASRLRDKLYLRPNLFNDIPANDVNYLPWVQPAEGYFMDGVDNEVSYTIDSVAVNPPNSGTSPRVEVSLYGAPDYYVRYGGVGVPHTAQVIVVPPTGSERLLGIMRFTGLVRARQSFAFQSSDISSTGTVTIKIRSQPPVAHNDFFYVSYLRTTAPEANAWFSSRNRLVFKNDSLQGGPAAYELSGVPATVAGFDIQDLYNVQRISGVAGGAAGTRRFVFPGANATASHQLMLVDETTAAVPFPARRVNFLTINPALPTFIIITHPQLMGPAGTVPNAAQAYATYRSSPAGGGYNVLMVTAPQLYDQFFYGDRSWLALRHFARWLVAANPTATNRNLLLLGKGIVPSERVAGAYFARNGESGVDLVPTNSRGVSDNLLTADYSNNDFTGHITTGRLTATTPAQVKDYLDKVMAYESAGDQPWRKNALHLIGTDDPGELVEFRGYMDRYKRHLERPLFGGTVVATVDRRTVGLPNTGLPGSIDISPYLNPGLGIISYFGHGSNTAFNLDIGYVSASPNYNNQGKYPILLFNGCAAGHTFTVTPTFFEDWLFTPNRGSVGAMGEYGFSYSYLLNQAQDTLTRLLFNDPRWYGKPVSAVYNEMARRLLRAPTSPGTATPFNDPTNPDHDRAVEQILCTIWHGDPTITLYAPPKPDFQVSNNTLSISPTTPGGTVNASSSDFILKIGVTNPRKVTTDSIEIRVTRMVSGQSAAIVKTMTFAQGPQGSATYNFPLTNPAGVNVFGSNTFTVELDYRNKVDESDETNNTAQTTFTFLRGGLTVLNPVEFAIVGNNTPRLVAQTNDPLGPQRVYEFEADTSIAFSSPAAVKRQSGPVTATLVASWRPTLPALGRDSVVWYWRARFQTPGPDEDPNWVVSSFRIIQGRTAGGWSQSHYGQFQRDQRQGVQIAAPSGHWSFSELKSAIDLRTGGGGVAGSGSTFNIGTGYGITSSMLGTSAIANCSVLTPNLLIAVYDEHTLRTVTGLPAPATCGQAPQQFYIFATPTSNTDTLNTLNNSASRQAQLAAFLAAVPDGDYVAVVSMNRLRWPSLTTVRSAFSSLLGSQLINQLQNGDPFVMLAQKRAGGGRLIRETGPITAAPTIPRYDQDVTLTDTLRTAASGGTITSTRIGPATSWDKVYQWIQREPGATSSYTLKVIGIDSLGHSTVVVPNVPAGSPQRGGYQLAISASKYPYLQLQLTMQDSVRRTAPQLKEWFITYQGVPEGVVLKDQVTPTTAYDAATLTAQSLTHSLTIPVVFENVTPFDFGTPLLARAELRDAQGSVKASSVVSAPSQLRGDSRITIPVVLPLGNNFGTGFTVKVTVNPPPRPLPELNLFNNELNLGPFSIPDTNVPPTLDVAIDGRHILNGELVSPMPIINIQLNDEDKVNHITDRTVFTVTLLRPGASAPQLVNLNGSDVNFSVDVTNGSVAKLEYRPGTAAPLPDGVYTLRVQGHDPRDANAGTQDFQVKFEVVNASKVTNVYPYPNPVISKARFVFTVTGQELPRNMKIQIMTLTGRVVREIFMNELGPLHIGNNITDFAWDGTDSYGDRLANGTYLYRVSLDDPNGQFGHRDTAGDQAFKNDWGKLVLMR